MIRYFKNNADFYSKAFLMIGFMCAIASSLSVGNKLWEDCYYHLLEASFFFYLLSHRLLAVCRIDNYEGFWKPFSLMVLLCAASTLFDEIFYDATEVEFNDLVRITVIAFVSFRKNIKIVW